MRWRGLAHLLTVGVLGTALTAAGRQAGTVRGEITLLERAGAGRKDVQTAVIYLEALDAMADDDRGTVSTEATIAMRGREFLPHTAVIRSGGAVKFPNQDPFSHNVFSNSDPVAFDLGLYRRGVTRSATFARPGVYPIYCNIHAKMVSYVVAVPGRHVTFAGPDGRFELSDVPVGTYRLHVWHERAARVSAVVTVTPTGATQPPTASPRPDCGRASSSAPPPSWRS